jgi:hypothetical protein
MEAEDRSQETGVRMPNTRVAFCKYDYLYDRHQFVVALLPGMSRPKGWRYF